MMIHNIDDIHEIINRYIESMIITYMTFYENPNNIGSICTFSVFHFICKQFKIGTYMYIKNNGYPRKLMREFITIMDPRINYFLKKFYWRILYENF